MPKEVDRFLARAPILEEGPSLGRVFAVVREGWLLSEDPRAIAPRTEIMANRRTALEAADFARESAEAFDRHGFHKPSGAWWASEGEDFHRFQVAPDRTKRGPPILLGLGVLALAVTALGAAVQPKRAS